MISIIKIKIYKIIDKDKGLCSLTTASSMTITEAMTTVMMINKKDKNKKVSMYGYYRAYLGLPNPLLSLCQGNGSNRA